jgi:hypothetical protein
VDGATIDNGDSCPGSSHMTEVCTEQPCPTWR